VLGHHSEISADGNMTSHCHFIQLAHTCSTDTPTHAYGTSSTCWMVICQNPLKINCQEQDLHGPF